ncbi:MAG: SPFH domain-containing protein [Candidimonas sp.]
MRKIAVALIAAIGLSACGEVVNVPPGEVAKESHTNGLEQEIRGPGGYRLSSCVIGPCPKLIKMQTFEATEEVAGNYFVPKSDLDMNMTVSVRFRVRNDITSINRAFETIKAEIVPESRTEFIITSERMFNTYVKPAVPDAVRRAVANYEIDAMMANLETTREYVEQVVKDSVNSTPIEVLSVQFSNVEWPEKVLERKRELRTIEDQRLIDLKRVETEMEVLAAKRSLAIASARVEIEVDEIVSERMGANMATTRMLNILQSAVDAGLPITIHPSMFPQKTFEME